MYKKSPSHNQAAFWEVCTDGNLPEIQRLIVLPDLDIHANHESAFRLVCENGHLKVAKWLTSKFPNIDAHACDESAFCWACWNGHLEVVFWLLTSTGYQPSKSACKSALNAIAEHQDHHMYPFVKREIERTNETNK